MRPVHAAALALTFTAAACATGGFKQVSFAAEASTTAQAPPGQTVYVVPNSQMADTALEAQIRARLERFLLEHGYVITNPDTAELYVLATFGSGTRLQVSQASVFRPAEVRVTRDASGNIVNRRVAPDRMESVRVPVYENSVWLQVLYSDARYFRETGMVRNLWRGESAMKGSAESLPAAAPYLLVPALRFFGKGTSNVVVMDVREEDRSWE